MTRARSLANRASDIVSVRDFGAVGDGVTDDTAAIQAAINAGSIFVPDGTYLVSSVTVSANGRAIVGQSKNAILKRKNLTYLPMVLVDGADYFYCTELTVDGNKAGNPLTGFTPSGGGSAITIDNQGDIVCKTKPIALPRTNGALPLQVRTSTLTTNTAQPVHRL